VIGAGAKQSGQREAIGLGDGVPAAPLMMELAKGTAGGAIFVAIVIVLVLVLSVAVLVLES
jgi:hypothetical protein